MKRSVFQSLVLTVIDIAAILIAYALYRIIGLPYLVLIQSMVGGLLVIVGFFFWYRFAISRGWELTSIQEVMGTYLAAFIWFLVIFILFHILTQGFLTGFGNVQASWLFQALVNGLALLAIVLNNPHFDMKGNKK
ncbi:MAG: hypothetical protein JXA13_01145 [Anaerolineales bacterium]|nr:hypothetical protein [Anaerolineales bacterium]